MDWNDMKLRTEAALAVATQANQIVDDAIYLRNVAADMKDRATEGDLYAAHEIRRIGEVFARHPEVRSAFCAGAADSLTRAAASVFEKVAGPLASQQATATPQASAPGAARTESAARATAPPADPPKSEKPKLTPDEAVEYSLNALANESTPDAINAYINKAHKRQEEGFFTQDQADRIVAAAEARLEAIPKEPGKAEIF